MERQVRTEYAFINYIKQVHSKLVNVAYNKSYAEHIPRPLYVDMVSVIYSSAKHLRHERHSQHV